RNRASHSDWRSGLPSLLEDDLRAQRPRLPDVGEAGYGAGELCAQPAAQTGGQRKRRRMLIFRARTLQGYVLKEFLRVFALTLLVCSLILLLAFEFLQSSEYEDKGVTIGQIALLSPFFFPKILALAIPPATMIAATMVFSRLTAEDELIAAQAG